MPELPELETIVRGLRPRLLGRRIVRARLRHKSLYRRGSLRVPWLVGRMVAAVERVGKATVANPPGVGAGWGTHFCPNCQR